MAMKMKGLSIANIHGRILDNDEFDLNLILIFMASKGISTGEDSIWKSGW
jgi:hypothetical protein